MIGGNWHATRVSIHDTVQVVKPRVSIGRGKLPHRQQVMNGEKTVALAKKPDSEIDGCEYPRLDAAAMCRSVEGN
jgi:hypothetical protein